MARRKICVVTGSRADYGLLRWLMEEIREDEALLLQVIATGAHLSSFHGHTDQAIVDDGFKIDVRIDMLEANDSPVANCRAMGKGLAGFAEAFNDLAPEIVVVLGDRFEILAAAEAAMMLRIPIAHLHGGELTEGSLDESIRHAVTKMANLHFVAGETYRNRVIQMGELPARVFDFGAPGLDAFGRLPLLDRSTLESRLEFPLGDTSLLVTYHPATLANTPPQVACQALLKALDEFPDVRLLITMPNADTGGREIRQEMEAYIARQANRAKGFTSLGQLLYLSALKQVTAMVGNSSSGLYEAPYAGIPTVNLGTRQKGREKPLSVIDCDETPAAIADAIRLALSADMRARARQLGDAVSAQNSSRRIKDALKTVEVNGILIKPFQDFSHRD